jgi:hypothetical protein
MILSQWDKEGGRGASGGFYACSICIGVNILLQLTVIKTQAEKKGKFLNPNEGDDSFQNCKRRINY